jgi:hypothetical protein
MGSTKFRIGQVDGCGGEIGTGKIPTCTDVVGNPTVKKINFAVSAF